MFHHLVFLLLSVTFLAAAPVPKELRSRSPRGTWHVEKLMLFGTETKPNGNDYWTIDDQGGLLQHPFANSPGGVDPQDRFVFDGKENALEYHSRGRVFSGIYESRGDSLWISYSLPGEVRPKDFGAKGTNFVWILSRAEK